MQYLTHISGYHVETNKAKSPQLEFVFFRDLSTLARAVI
jgi:hypothetical protein